MYGERVGQSPPASTRYQVISKIGCGGYGNVYKAHDTRDGAIVALKRVRCFSLEMGVPNSFYRENSCLRDPALQECENIVKLKECYTDDVHKCPVMVMEYCEFDLSGLIHHGLTCDQFRFYAVQVMRAIEKLHSNNYVHRDIKPANIFVTKDNIVKLGDFGLARKLTRDARPLTQEVVTPSYRSPELLLGDRNYGKGVDMWSLACVFYEMITGKRLFVPSTSGALSQLTSIFKVCGTPTTEAWPNIQNLPDWGIISQMAKSYPPILSELLDDTLPCEFYGIKDLLLSMLEMNPENRITIDDALNHPFFIDICESLPTIILPETHTSDVSYSIAVQAAKPRSNNLLRLRRALPPAIYA